MFARVGNVGAINLLIAYSAEVNIRNVFGNTPLHEAVKAGHFEAVKALVACGADVTMLDRYGRDPEDVAWGPACKARGEAREDIIDFLAAEKSKH